MRHLVFTILLDFGLTACANNTSGETSANRVQAATVAKVDTIQEVPTIAQAASKKSDTLIVSTETAVFIRPNDARIEKEKKKGDEEGFYITAADYLYYMATAQEFLDSVKVPIVDVRNEKFIKFAGNNKKRQLININKLPELWNIYFFDPTKKAKQVDMTAIDEEYRTYFK